MPFGSSCGTLSGPPLQNAQFFDRVAQWVAAHPLLGDQTRMPAAWQEGDYSRPNSKAELDQSPKPARRAPVAQNIEQIILEQGQNPQPDHPSHQPRLPRTQQDQ